MENLSMSYAKIRLSKSATSAAAFVVLAKQYRVVGIREQGEVLYQVPTEALSALDRLGVNYDLVDGDLAEPVRPTSKA